MYFILQARLGSSRLPGKILMPFHDGASILDIITGRLLSISENIIIATTVSSVDDPIADYARQSGIKLFRGPEEDVLARFIGAAEAYNVKDIIRVCCDNPFLTSHEINKLVNEAVKTEADYMSFSINGRPSITTHYGFFTEFVTVDALKKVTMLTREKLYHEHVTNFIYTHPDKFDVKFIDVTDQLGKKPYIRLTIDTPTDFSNAACIYRSLKDNKLPLTIENIVAEVERHPEMIAIMKGEIEKNSK